jgi:hypothetical protein
VIRAYVLVYRAQTADRRLRREIVDAYSADDARARASTRSTHQAEQWPLVDVEPFDRRRKEHLDLAHRDWPQAGGGPPPHLLSDS